MINRDSLAAIEKGYFGNGFCRPVFDTYGFSRLPGTFDALLTGNRHNALPEKAFRGEQVDCLFVFLIDGFGWRFFEKYASDYPFLRRFIEEGVASKITSLFPSTTAAHATCLNAGADVAQTGVYEWFYYEPKVDRMIAPLLFSFAGDKEPGTLSESGISPEEIYPTETFYQKLKRKGVESYGFKHHAIVDSPYSSVMYQGSVSAPYHELEDGLELLVSIAQKPRKQPAYFYFYFGEIDSMGHRYGIHSQHFERAVERCFIALEDFFWKKLGKLGKKSACAIIADHGMTEINPQKTYYLNEKMPELLPLIQRNRSGQLIAPAGSCRDFFLHIQEEKIEEAEKMVKKSLGEKSWIVPTKQLIKEGFFGPSPPSKTFLSRVGNLVILPYEGESVWWLERGRFDQHFLGAHGGLTKNEMETIFLFNTIPTI